MWPACILHSECERMEPKDEGNKPDTPPTHTHIPPLCSKEQGSQGTESVEVSFKDGTGQRRTETSSVKPGTTHQDHCRRVRPYTPWGWGGDSVHIILMRPQDWISEGSHEIDWAC